MAHAEVAAAKKEAHRVAARESKRKKAQQNQGAVDNQPTSDNTEESGSQYPSNGPPDQTDNAGNHQSPWAAHGKTAPGDDEPEPDDDDEKENSENDDRRINLRAFVNKAREAAIDAKSEVKPITESEWQVAIDAADTAAAAWGVAAHNLRRTKDG
jgi:hypothetical protein